MNTKSKLALSLGLLLAGPAALLAWSPEKAYVDSYRARSVEVPVPTSVVSPDVSPRFAGKKVVFEFVVDATGKPSSITPVTPNVDAELVASVSAAVSQWKFTPAVIDGKPVARKVALPVNIVANYADGLRFAAN